MDRLAALALVATTLGLAALVDLRTSKKPVVRRDDHVEHVGHRRPDQPGEAMAYYVSQRAPDGVDVPVERYAAAVAKKSRMLAPRSSAKLGKVAWQPAGPPTVGGRTRALLIDPADPNLMYAAGASGGVWKSTDGASTWQSTGDAFANLATNALVMDPNDRRTLYAGTGEGLYVNRPVTRSRGVRGDGVYVTNDAGGTWRQLDATAGNANFDYVNALVIDRTGRLHAATRTGLHTSADRGATWTRGYASTNVEGCSELVEIPSTGRLIATCGVFSQSTMQVSDDAGATWRAVALPTNAGRTTLAVAKSNPLVVYALTAHATDYNFLRLARSNDGGTTWTTVVDRASADPLSLLVLSNPIASVDEQCRNTAFLLGQGWYDNAIAVDPVNPDIVYVGGIDQFRSDDGGRTFKIASRWWVEPSEASFAHADQHVITFDPRYDGVSNRRMWIANDGGVFVTENARGALSADVCAETGGLAWTQKNQGYRVTQFYHGALSGDGTQLVGGTQDNGTVLGTNTATPWREVFGGDGGYSAIDPRDARRMYASTPQSGFVRSDDAFETFTEIRDGLPAPTQNNYLFIAPFLLDPNDPDVLWTGGGSRVYRSTNRGGSWSATSTTDVTPPVARVSALAVARGDSNRVAVGFDNGVIGRSSDGGRTWRTSTPRTGVVSSLAIDGDDTYATYSTFGGTKVWRAAGDGSFTALDGASAELALPDVPAHVLLVDPRDRARLWLGTDIGLFSSPDRGARWYADASGLGNVLIEQLLVAGTAPASSAPDTRELVAFTYGRGAFRARLADLSTPAVNPGLAGAWYERATAGQGLQVEVIPAAGAIAVGWYTYARDPTPTPANHLWLIGSAALVDGVATVPLFRVPQGRFAGPAVDAPRAVGTLTIAFDGCTRASATYAIDAGGGSTTGELALERLTAPALCEAFRALGDGALSASAVPANPGDFEAGHSGSWLAANAAQQGFVFDVDPASRTMVASWYAYDGVANGAGESATWFTAQGAIEGPRAELAVFRTTGGAFDQGGGASTARVGTLRLEARSCERIDAEYALTLANGERTGRFELARVAPPTLCLAMAP